MKWKKIVGWFVLGSLALLVVLFAAAAIVLRTQAFHRFVIAQIESRVERSTGAHLAIGSIAIHVGSLSVDAYNLVLNGGEAATEPPLLTATHLGVSVTIVSLLERKFALNSVALDNPELHLHINRQGIGNLPVSPVKAPTPAAVPAASPAGAIFDLAVRQVGVHSGNIYFNDEKVPLSAELHDFQTEINFSSLTQQYKASLSYDRGRLEISTYKPIQHDAQVQLTATRSGASLDSLTLTSGRSRITAQAKLTNYQDPSIDGSYQALVSTTELGRAMNSPSIPAGDVSLRGTLRYHSEGQQSFLDSVSTDGNMESAALAVRAGSASASATSVRAAYHLKNGNLSVQNVRANLLGGALTGSYQMLHMAANPASRVSIALKGVQLETANRTFLPRSQQPLIAGQMNLSASAAWTGSVSDGSAHAVLLISAPSQAPQGSARIPVSANITLDYDGVRNTAALHQSFLRTPAMNLTVSGVLSDHSNLAVQATVTDLSELDSLISAMPASDQTVSANASLNRLGLKGSTRFTGTVRGSARKPDITGQLAVDNFEIAGSRWRALRAGIDVNSNQAALQNVTLSNATQGQIAANARIALSDWSFTPDSAISAQATIARLSVADLEHLANLRYPITGELAANLSFSGSELHPAGNGTLTLTQAVLWNEPVQQVFVQIQGDGASIRTTEQVRAPAGVLSATLNYSPGTKAYDFSLNTTGLNLADVRSAQARGTAVAGNVTGSATGHGTLDDPQLDGTFRIASLQVSGRTVPQVDLQLAIARQHATLALNASLNPGNVQVMGDVNLTGEYPVTASADIQQLPVGLLAAAYLPSGGPAVLGQIDIHATLSGPLRDPAQLQAHVEIPKIGVGYKTQQITNAKPLVLDYRNRAITIQPTEITGSGTDLTLQGAIPLSNSAPLAVSLKGMVDLAALRSLSTDVDSSGQIQIDLSTAGTLSKPSMQGQIRIVNATLSSGSIPIGFSSVNGQLTMQGNRIQIDRLTASAGGGAISATGSASYGTPSTFSINLNAQTVRIRYPEGVRSVVEGEMQLNGTSNSSILSGRILIDDLSLDKEFDIGTLASTLGGGTESGPASPLESNMKLNLAIASSQNLNAQSTQLSIAGAANLNLQGTVAHPVVLGRMTLTGGDIFFRGQRYQVQSGTIAFGNPVRTDPILNLFIVTTIQQYDITLNFVGPMDRLKTNYTSSPSLPPADIINLIARGQTTEAQATSSTPAAVGAESALASQVAGQISGPLQKLGGFSQLTIDPLAGANSADPGAQLAFQKRITGNLLITFSTNITTSQNESVQLQYQATPTISVSVLRDQNGGYALDIRIRRTF